ncbi:type VI secretion system Vgr family protein [Moellerella wisconsensis]|uniref:Type VI secretion system tip protein VgrG n=1 Tax=Moellerella wisconsensis TaxID=158849 RepID=A0ACD3YBL5_9GAMM|nr:type VI secretion system Vgr family protein [Moellerella wisconsensis]UNH39824.1 type VI secretion system tip protein VgrG [Moellerella wisconsensis]
MTGKLAPFFSLQAYQLQIQDAGFDIDILKFEGVEKLNVPSSWQIEFTSTSDSITPEQILLKPATFSLASDKRVSGVITRLQWLSTSADQSHYAVLLEPRLALLGHTQRSTIYQNTSVIEVVEKVLQFHGFEGADYEFKLEHQYPERELITQWRETDLAFIQRLLAEVGIGYRLEYSAKTDNDKVVFFDSQLNYQFGEKLPYQLPSGQNDNGQLSVWDGQLAHQVVTGNVTVKDYNYRTALSRMETSTPHSLSNTTLGDEYHYAPPYLQMGDENAETLEAESGAFYSRLRQARFLNPAAEFELQTNAFYLMTGSVLDIANVPINELKDGVFITQITYRAARDTSLQMTLKGMPYSEQYAYRPAEIHRPKIAGTLPARIESRNDNDIYAWLDEQGRYRVKLDFDRNHSESGYAYLWLRLAKPYVGETYGLHAPLIANTEVAIAFEDGDIDRPYIAFAFHDSEHPDHVNRDNHTRNVLRTPANNKLRMEDKREKTHIKLATEYGKTQLNQGHLVDAQGKIRGTGAELRTDEWGAIRAGKGLFISADEQPKAQGDVLDMEAALKEIAHLLQQREQLNLAAKQAKALQADIESQKKLLQQRLEPLNQSLLFSAPQGMAFTSGEHLQLAASENVSINADGNISVGVIGNMTMSTGDKLGLFARTGKLGVIAGEGPLTVQAQNNRLDIFSEQKQTITSAADINFTGKKRIILNGGGSYLKLENGKIEYGTSGDYLRKIPKMATAGPNTLPMKMAQFPVLPLPICIPCLLNAITGNDPRVDLRKF